MNSHLSFLEDIIFIIWTKGIIQHEILFILLDNLPIVLLFNFLWHLVVGFFSKREIHINNFVVALFLFIYRCIMIELHFVVYRFGSNLARTISLQNWSPSFSHEAFFLGHIFPKNVLITVVSFWLGFKLGKEDIVFRLLRVIAVKREGRKGLVLLAFGW